ncbi:MAG: glycosyltransferase [Fimbriimonadaceae bacterium]
MARRKLLVIDHPFHAQTRSSDFFIDLLRSRFDVVVDYLKVHPTDTAACVAQVRAHAPDLLFLWQVAFRARALVELGLPTTWAPMYDQSRRLWHQNYLEATQTGVSVLAFSREVGRFARYWGLPTHDVSYYPAPRSEPSFGANSNRVLLWYRGMIQPRELWPVLKGITDLRVVIKHDVDPDGAKSARDDGELGPFIEQVVEGFMPGDAYTELVESCGLFVAPRRKEGIGLSFLEAMARGALVVGYNAPTMSEYIRHAQTGWLFDEVRREPVPAALISAIRRAAYEQVVQGRGQWEAATIDILDAIEGAPIPARRRGLKPMVAAAPAAAISALTPLKRSLAGG